MNLFGNTNRINPSNGQVHISPDDSFLYVHIFGTNSVTNYATWSKIESCMVFLDIDSKNNWNRPLSDDELRKFRSKRIFLVKEISLNCLLDYFIAVGWINEMHKAGIEKHKDRYDKIRQLLDIIQRRSFIQYQLFLGCLRSTHQEHVCDLLERDGGICLQHFLLSSNVRRSVLIVWNI